MAEILPMDSALLERSPPVSSSPTDGPSILSVPAGDADGGACDVRDSEVDESGHVDFVRGSYIFRKGEWMVHRSRVAKGLFAPCFDCEPVRLGEHSMVYAFCEKVADGGTSLPDNTRKVLTLLASLQHLLLGTSRYVANAYLPNLDRFRCAEDTCGSRKTVSVVQDGQESGVSDLHIHVRLVKVRPTDTASTKSMNFFVVIVMSPHVLNLRRAVDLDTSEPGSNQLQVNLRNAQRRGNWQEIIRSAFSLGASMLDVPDFKRVIGSTTPQEGFTGFFNLGATLLRMRLHAQTMWGVGETDVFLEGWEDGASADMISECIEAYHAINQAACAWDEEWVQQFNQYAALSTKNKREFECALMSVDFTMIPVLFAGALPPCKSVMVFLGSGHHSSDDAGIKDIPAIVAGHLRCEMLPESVRAQLQDMPDQLSAEGFVTIGAATKIVYSQGEHEETGMKAKSSLPTYEHFRRTVLSLEPERRAEAELSLAWNSVLFVASECQDAVRYTCPDVLNRLAAFKPLGAVADARGRGGAAFAHLLQGQQAAHESAFVQPCLGAHLLAGAALRQESDLTDGMNPGNMHILMLLWQNSLIGVLDYTEGAIRGAPNGIGTGIWICDGGGSYMSAASSEKQGDTRVYLNKTYSTGADFVVGRFKALVNPATYVAGLSNIDLETVSDFTQHGVRVDCSDIYKEGALFKKATQRRVNYNFFVTELQFTKDSAIENTLVDIVVRETSDNATKTRMSTAKSDADSRGALKYFFVNRPRVSVLACNNVTPQAYERIRTLTEVLRVTCSAVWGLRGDMTGVVAANRVSSASACAASRWMFLDTLAVAAGVALVQREGLLGPCIGVLGSVSAVWFVFTSELVRVTGYWAQRFQDERSMKRIRQQSETRGVMRSLLAMSGAAFFPGGAGDTDKDDANDIKGLIARVGLRFRTSCLHSAVLPAMMCDLLDQLLSGTSILMISLLAAQLHVPVVDESVLLEWFSTGEMKQQSEGVRILRDWWERTHATNAFVETGPMGGAVYVSLAGSCRAASAFAQHYRAGASEEQATRQAYDCSAFQTEKREHDQKVAVCTRLAQQIFSSHGDLLTAAALVQQDFIFTELCKVVDRVCEFPLWYAVQGSHFNDVHGLLQGANLSIPEGLPRVDDGTAKQTPQHIIWKLIPGTTQRPVWTLGVDLRVLLWFTSVVGQGRARACTECVSQYSKSLVAVSMVSAFYRNMVPKALCPFSLVSSDLPDPRGGGVLTMEVCAGRGMGRERTTLLRPLDDSDHPFVDLRDSVRVPAPTLEALRLPTAAGAPRLVCGQTQLFPSGMVEDVALCEDWMAAAAHLKLEHTRMLPVGFFQSTMCMRQWVPVLLRETGCVGAYRAETTGMGSFAVEIACIDRIDLHAQLPTLCGFMDARALLPLPFICRRGVLVLLEKDEEKHQAPESGAFADVVAGARVERGVSHSCVYAVVGLDEREGWFGPELTYTLYKGEHAVFRVGVGELHDSLVPRGSWLRIGFERGFFLNLLQRAPSAFLLPFVHGCDWDSICIWGALTHAVVDDGRCYDEHGAYIQDSVFVVVDELTMLGDVCDERGRFSNRSPTVEHRRVTWVVRVGDLCAAQDVAEEDMRGCYFV